MATSGSTSSLKLLLRRKRSTGITEIDQTELASSEGKSSSPLTYSRKSSQVNQAEPERAVRQTPPSTTDNTIQQNDTGSSKGKQRAPYAPATSHGDPFDQPSGFFGQSCRRQGLAHSDLAESVSPTDPKSWRLPMIPTEGDSASTMQSYKYPDSLSGTGRQNTATLKSGAKVVPWSKRFVPTREAPKPPRPRRMPLSINTDLDSSSTTLQSTESPRNPTNTPTSGVPFSVASERGKERQGSSSAASTPSRKYSLFPSARTPSPKSTRKRPPKTKSSKRSDHDDRQSPASTDPQADEKSAVISFDGFPEEGEGSSKLLVRGTAEWGTIQNTPVPELMAGYRIPSRRRGATRNCYEGEGSTVTSWLTDSHDNDGGEAEPPNAYPARGDSLLQSMASRPGAGWRTANVTVSRNDLDEDQLRTPTGIVQHRSSNRDSIHSLPPSEAGTYISPSPTGHEEPLYEASHVRRSSDEATVDTVFTDLDEKPGTRVGEKPSGDGTAGNWPAYDVEGLGEVNVWEQDGNDEDEASLNDG